jgi:hypothetical protein
MNDLAKTEDKLPKLFRKDMSRSELRAITLWEHCDGDQGKFEKMAEMSGVKGKRPLWHLLHTDKVRRFIEQRVKEGKCLPLIASKDEVSMELTSKMRRFGNINDIKELNAMRGYTKDPNSNGGTVVQILIQGNLGD